MTASPTWLTAVVDLPRPGFEQGAELLARLTGYDPYRGRGEDRELRSLMPPTGDPFLRVQRLRSDQPRVHLDVHVPDVSAAAEQAGRLGATVRGSARGSAGPVVLDSPGGLPFCLLDGPERVRPGASPWPGGHHSLLDQVSIDAPREVYDGECEFWARLTGWRCRTSRRHPELAHLMRPEGIALRILLQRTDESTGPVRAHLDWATDDRLRETERHVREGAAQGVHRDSWTVMRGPAGLSYCLTDRHPGTGA